MVPQLTIQLQQGQDAFRVLLGMAPQPLAFLLTRSTGEIPVAPRKVVVGVPADLLRRRPDIRAAELRAAAQSAQIGVATAELFPAISILGKFGGSASTLLGGNLSNIFQPSGRNFTVGPSFQWNILNYGQITNNVRLQDATLQQYLVDYQNSVLTAQALGDLRRRNGAPATILKPDLLAKLRLRLDDPPPDGGLWSSRKVAAWMAGELNLTSVAPQRGWEALKAIGWSIQKPRPKNPKSATPEEAAAFKKSARMPLPRRRQSTRANRSRSSPRTSIALA